MDFKKVTIIGGGVLGSQIAFQSAYCGFEVAVLLRTDESIQRTKTKLEELRKTYISIIENMKNGGPYYKGITNETNLSSIQIDKLKENLEKSYKTIQLTTDFESACKGADIVIESISEIPDQKKELYKKLSKYLEPNTILATNTSTLLPSTLAEYTGRPDKFLAYHFANEIWKFNITEIMGHQGTDKKCFKIMEDFSKRINMIPSLLLKERPGYILTSLVSPWLKSALNLWGDGFAEPQSIDLTWTTATNSPMGPFQSMDLIGVNSLYNVVSMDPESKKEGTSRYNVRMKLKDMMDKGKLGKESGEGFYKYK